MGREHEPSVVFRAQELYCADRLPMERVRDVLLSELGEAEAPAMSTLWRWSDKYAWGSKREEIAKALADIAADTVLARAAMLKELIASRDAQTGFAVASLEGLALKQAEAARAGRATLAAQEASVSRRKLLTAEDAATALQEAVELKLASLLADPGQVDLKAVKNIMEALDAVATLRPKDAEESAAARDKGLSIHAAEQILNKILMGK